MDRNRRLEWSLGGVAIALGLLQTWATRDSIDLDVVAYLDMGDALLRGDWATGLNGTWNPFYGLLLGIVVRVMRVSPAQEYALVHGVLFGIFLLTLLAFAFFLRQLLAATSPAEKSGPTRSWLLLGYVAFTWSALDVIGVSTTNPDMLVAASVYAATGLLIRIRRDASRRLDGVWLGLILGLSYLTKAYMFLVAVFFLAALALAVGRRHALRTVGLATATFLVVAAPFVLSLSHQRGHLTVSESGRINYAWHVNGLTPRQPGGEPLAHPLRNLLESPPTFSVDRPIRVTYPYFYDVSYWYEGARVPFRPTSHVALLRGNLITIAEVAYGPNGAFVVGLLILGLLHANWKSVANWTRTHGYFVAPSALGLLPYALVHVESRYIGGFLVVILLGAFLALAGDGSRDMYEPVRAIAIAAWVLLLLPGIGRGSSPRYYSYLLHPSAPPVDPLQIPKGPSTASPWRVATALKELGVEPGERVGTVQHAARADAVWARLARVKIVSEVWPLTPDEEFWNAPEPARRQVIEAMIRAGARAIISDSTPPETASEGWAPLAKSGYYIRFAEAPAESEPR